MIAGDIRHSRVAQSNIKLLLKMGAEVGVCGPDHFMPETMDDLQRFEISEGIKWSSVSMALRIQLERHPENDAEAGQKMTDKEYHQTYGIDSARIPKTMS